MKTVYIVPKNPHITKNIYNVFPVEGGNGLSEIYVGELVKETPKGWKVTRNGYERFFHSLTHELFVAREDAARSLLVKLQAEHTRTLAHINDVALAMEVCREAIR